MVLFWVFIPRALLKFDVLGLFLPKWKNIRKQRIAMSLGNLNERERHCLLLRAEGLSYKEIADVVGISAKAVSVYLARGLKKFEADR